MILLGFLDRLSPVFSKGSFRAFRFEALHLGACLCVVCFWLGWGRRVGQRAGGACPTKAALRGRRGSEVKGGTESHREATPKAPLTLEGRPRTQRRPHHNSQYQKRPSGLELDRETQYEITHGSNPRTIADHGNDFRSPTRLNRSPHPARRHRRSSNQATNPQAITTGYPTGSVRVPGVFGLV